MAVFGGDFTTYDAIGNREDLSDVIYNIDPIETPFMASIGRGRASATVHEWQTDQLDAAAFNAVIESNDIAFTAITPTIRPQNVLQISQKDVIISGTQEAVDKAGRKSEMAYQLARKAKSLKRDVEFTIVQDQVADAGGTATARALSSAEQWLGPAPVGGLSTSNRGATGADATFLSNGTPDPANAVDDGTQRPLLESMVKGVVQAVWQNGGDPTLFLCGGFNKTTISTFTGNSTRYDMGEDKRLVAAIDIYVSDFGTHRVVPDRFSRDRSLLIITPSLWSLDYLRPFMQTPLAKSGDAEKRLLNTEYTLRASNHFGSGVVADLTTTA